MPGRPFWLSRGATPPPPVLPFIDEFNYGTPGAPAVPDPLKWTIISSTVPTPITPSVDGTDLLLEEASSPQPHARIESIPIFPAYFTSAFSIYFEPSGLAPPAHNGSEDQFLLSDGLPGGEFIQLRYISPSLNFRTRQGGIIESSVLAVNPYLGVFTDFEIRWLTGPNKVEMWDVTGVPVLLFSHTVRVPSTPLRLALQGRKFSGTSGFGYYTKFGYVRLV